MARTLADIMAYPIFDPDQGPGFEYHTIDGPSLWRDENGNVWLEGRYADGSPCRELVEEAS
jgi:hypothetical protein